jgi:glycosyltransferase involved in cell wall biosynthesis
MRLVAVQTGLNPHSVLGGTITDREFLTRLADRGVEVHVLAEAGEPIVAHGNLTHHYWRRRLRKPIPYVGNVDVALDLRRLLRGVGPVDWIRFNSPYSVGIGTLFGRTGQRIWGSYLHCEDRWPLNWIDRWVPAYCDLITCLSDDTRSDVVARCPAADRPSTVVVPMGIDAGRFECVRRGRQEVRATLSVGDADVLILYAGVLIPRKGIKDLVQAWRLLGARPGVRLLVIGRSLSREEAGLVSTLVEEDGRVTHIERVPYEQMPEYFQASDVFLFPTHLEGFGIVVGEAMACGLPVVTTRAKGVREVVVENETALLADVGSPEQLAKHLDQLVTDESLRKRLGSAGKARVKGVYDWDGIMDRLMLLLTEGHSGEKARQGDQ